MSRTSEKCSICLAAASKYSCPKCSMNYCSLDCYRSLSHLDCSESFYKECIEKELAVNSPERSQNVGNILKQYHNLSESKEDLEDSNLILDSDDSEEELSLEERLRNVDLNNEQTVWEKLTKEEQENFKSMLATGKILEILPDWLPWWISMENVPSVTKDIPSFRSLFSKSPSPSLPFNIFNCLIAYQVTLRWFKGEAENFFLDAASTILVLSPCLNSDVSVNSISDAYTSFATAFDKCEWIKNSKLQKGEILEDLKALNENSYIINALSDIRKLLEMSIDTVRQNNVGEICGKPPGKRTFSTAIRKCIFYQAFLKDVLDAFENIDITC